MKLSILLPIVLKTVFLVTFAFLLTEKPAHAYLDPGTGSYATQVLIAGLAGAAFAIKNLLLRFTRNRKGGSSSPVAANRIESSK